MRCGGALEKKERLHFYLGAEWHERAEPDARRFALSRATAERPLSRDQTYRMGNRARFERIHTDHPTGTRAMSAASLSRELRLPDLQLL